MLLHHKGKEFPSKPPLRTVQDKHSRGEKTNHFRVKMIAVRGSAMIAMVALTGR